MRGREGGIDGWTVEEEEKRCLAFAYRDDTSVQKGRNLKKTRKRRLAAHHQISFYSPFPPPPSFFWYLPSVGSLTSHANLPPYSITHRTEKRGNRPTSDTTNRNKQIVDEYVYLLQGKEKEGKTHGNHRAQVKQEKASATITTTTKKKKNRTKQNKKNKKTTWSVRLLFLYTIHRRRAERNKCWWMVFGLRIDLHVDVCVCIATSRQRLHVMLFGSLQLPFFSPFFILSALLGLSQYRHGSWLLAALLYMYIYRFLLVPLFCFLPFFLATCLSISIDINWYDMPRYMIIISFLFSSRLCRHFFF